jgi:hypothetical protein
VLQVTLEPSHMLIALHQAVRSVSQGAQHSALLHHALGAMEVVGRLPEFQWQALALQFQVSLVPMVTQATFGMVFAVQQAAHTASQDARRRHHLRLQCTRYARDDVCGGFSDVVMFAGGYIGRLK